VRADARRRARAITKAQRDRRERNVVNRAVDLLVRSSEPAAFAANGVFAKMKVGPGEIVRNGDDLYMSSDGRVTTKQQSTSFAIGVAVAGARNPVAATGDVVTVRLHHRG
jgi:hypothetical protein